MKVGIIGAGFTGLAAAHTLLKLGYSVTVIEKAQQPGGLALGFQEKNWDWTLEEHYHHWFTNDKAILDLAKELNYPVRIQRPKTSVLIQKQMYQLDSPTSVLTFPKLSLIDRLRMLIVLGLLKVDPFWQPLEKVNASTILPQLMGNSGYKMIWEPQFINKFGGYYQDISLAWFWARIAKRTSSLAYPEKGFLAFAQTLARDIHKKGGVLLYDTQTIEIRSDKKVILSVKENEKKQSMEFDAVIVTLPTFVFTHIAPQLPDSYIQKLKPLKGIGAINLILRLNQKFLSNGTYWLSICEKHAPVTAIVEHTNFMDKKYYNNEHIVYLGNYLPTDHEYFSFTPPQLLNAYHPLLQQIHPNYKNDLIGLEMFKAPFAQPIIPVEYSKYIPPHKTPLPNVYLANMQQVYPWDRGTNYAVELGQRVARLLPPS